MHWPKQSRLYEEDRSKTCGSVSCNNLLNMSFIPRYPWPLAPCFTILLTEDREAQTDLERILQVSRVSARQDNLEPA